MINPDAAVAAKWVSRLPPRIEIPSLLAVHQLEVLGDVSTYLPSWYVREELVQTGEACCDAGQMESDLAQSNVVDGLQSLEDTIEIP